MPIESSGEIRLRGAAGDNRTDINEEINGNATDTDVSLGTLNTSAFTNVADGTTVSGRSMSEMRGYAAFDSAFPSTEADGALGESLLLNSNDSTYLRFTPSLTGNELVYTVSCWVKKQNDSTVYLLGSKNGSYLDGGIIQLSGNTVSYSVNGNVYNKNFTIPTLDYSSWYNFVMAIDHTKSYVEDRIRLYINGIEIKEYSTANSGLPPQNYNSPAFNQSNVPIDIGMLAGYFTAYADITIADFKFIDGKQLRPDSFGELVQGIWIPKAFNTPSTDTEITANLLANYQLNGDVTDETTNYNGTNTNVTFYPNNYGIGDFNGSSSKITLPSSANLSPTNNFSCSVWFNSDVSSTFSSIIAYNASAGPYWSIFTHSSGTNNLRISVAGNNYYTPDYSYRPGEWHHVSFSKSSTTGVQVYLDGIKVVDEPSATSNASAVDNGDVRIGSYKNNYYYFNGKIGAVKIFNAPLTESENLQEYNATKHKYTYGLNGFWLPLNNTSTGSIDSSSNLKLHLDASDSSSYSGSGTNWNDLTSNNNDGTISGASFLSSTNGGVFIFDGSNDKVDLNSLQSFFGQKQTFTVELWFNAPSSSTGNRSLFDDYNYSNQNIALYLYDGVLNYFGRYNNIDIGGINSGSVTYNDNKWHHVIVTSDQSTIKLYADGKLIDSGSVPSASYSGGTPSVGIGRQTHPGSSTYGYWVGKIAQVRVYDKALTAQEVITNYRATQGNYEQVSTVDISGNANSFTSTNIDATDHIKDEPLDNYPTFSFNQSAMTGSNCVYSNGGLTVDNTSIGSAYARHSGPALPTTGKWYWEATYTGNGFGYCLFSGIVPENFWYSATGSSMRQFAASYGIYGLEDDGDFWALGTNTLDLTTLNTTDKTAGFAYDADNGDLYIYIEGVVQNSGNAVATGLSGEKKIFAQVAGAAGHSGLIFDFGQNGFKYDPPIGYLSLNTKNLPAPAFDPDGATPDKPSNYFKAVTYQGNGGTQGEAYGYKEGSRAAVFNGSSSRITIPEISPDSISMWINLDTLNRYDAPLGHSTNTANYIYWADSSESYQLRLGGSLFGSGTAKDTVGAVGGWVNVIFVDNGSGTVTCYINGNSAGSVSGSLPSFNEIGGRTAGTDQYLQGKIDEVRFFDKALNSTEVGYLYNDDTSNIDAISNLVAHYDMEGDANDSSGYAGDTVVTLSSDAYGYAYANSSVNAGKYYWEIDYFESYYGSTGVLMAGVVNTNYKTTSWHSGTNYFYYAGNGNKYSNGSSSGYSSAYNAPVTIGVKLDMTNGTIGFTRNGSDLGTAYTGLSGYYHPAVGTGIAADKIKFVFDSNDWVYSAPSGYSEWTAQITSPIIAGGGATAVQETYNGTDTNITYTQDKPYGNIDVGFAPDLVWIKSRNASASHVLSDSVRGANLKLRTNSTAQEAGTDYGVVTSFDANGFTVGGTIDTGDVNYFDRTYVAWAWKAGGKAVENTDGVTSGSVTAVTSTVSANQDAGFSINKFTTPSSGFPSWGHGLSESPELIILKATGLTQNWIVYAPSILGQKDGNLNTTAAFTSYSPDIISVDSSKIDIGRSGYGLSGSSTYIAYCFHSVDGFSKIGSYTGNGSSDGPFVYTGFKPAWIMVKSASAGNSYNNWFIYDNARTRSNATMPGLAADVSGAEFNNSSGHLTFSNGFKINSSGGEFNTNGHTYIYMAFAEDPVKYSNGVATLGDGNEFIQGGNYPEDNFNTTLYTGTGAAQKITTGIDADFVWTKTRTYSSVTSHRLVDTLRGPKNHLYLPNNLIETFDAAGITIEDDGFSFAGNEGANLSGAPTVAWSWKAAGNANTYNILENGTVTSSASASTLGLTNSTVTLNGISANKDNGFSIIKYTASGDSGQKVDHGLSKPPEFMIIKNLTTAQNWLAYNTVTNLGNSDLDYGYLSLNYAFNYYGNSGTKYPDSSIINLGTSTFDGSSDSFICYAWHSVPGFSKIGYYTSNASVKIQTGFQPKWIMIKYAGVANNWWIMDTHRYGGETGLHGGMLVKPYLIADDSVNESSGPINGSVEFVEDGFYPTNFFNSNGVIYMAFAHR
jgi:hypothetical protein